MNSDLLETITTLSHQTHEPSHDTIQSINILIDVTMVRVVTAVVKELLNANMMLLPDVHELFNSYASVWLHVRKTQYKMSSPDADVYNIILPLPSIQEKEVIV